MVNSNGSFPGFPLVDSRGRWCALVFWTLLASVAAAASTQDYLHTALANFVPEAPKNWAYTLKTEREGQQTIERFDPSKVPAEQWALLRTEGHAPNGQELEKYFKYKASQAPGPMQVRPAVG